MIERCISHGRFSVGFDKCPLKRYNGVLLDIQIQHDALVSQCTRHTPRCHIINSDGCAAIEVHYSIQPCTPVMEMATILATQDHSTLKA